MQGTVVGYKLFLSARPGQARVQSVSVEMGHVHASGIAFLVKRDEIPQALFKAHEQNRQCFVVTHRWCNVLSSCVGHRDGPTSPTPNPTLALWRGVLH